MENPENDNHPVFTGEETENETGSKIYYRISEVAEMLNVTQSLLRYWETQFSGINPLKNRKGDRLYRDKDIQRLKLIYHLVKVQGLTLDGARERLKYNKPPDKQKDELRKTLEEVRNFLQNIRDQL